MARQALAILFLLGAPALQAQTFPTADPVLRRMWDEGMTERSQVEALAQVLLDSIGPRLTGSPGHQSAVEWLQQRYRQWGIPVRAEQYGTWRSWQRGRTHVDLIAPRLRTLEGTMLAWSPGTNGAVEGDVVLLPEAANAAALQAALPGVRGKFVLLSPAEPTCRAWESWEQLARPASVERIRQERAASRRAWQTRLQAGGRGLVGLLEEGGALGVLTTNWSEGWGVNKVFDAPTTRIPALDLSCEDYGLVFRLAVRGQGARLRLDAQAEFRGDVPVFNVVAELRGSEKPDEYVLLGAHLDSWDGASGATDNGTGTVMMLEAARLLKLAYPNPKRTILIGHWGGEEQGLLGSRSFAEDHPEIVRGIHAAFNQDNGTWRVEYIRMMGLTGAGAYFGRWLSLIPPELGGDIELDLPGVPERGGSDHMAFLCHGAPSFRLQSHYPDYRQYTWHTTRDTWDKIVFDDLRNNATLAAMLAYLAAEDAERMPRDQRVLPQGEVWPRCSPPQRNWR
jgi:carboxypeptidase Q